MGADGTGQVGLVGEAEVGALGASRPEFQPGGGEWTVLTDPEGHPLCIAEG
ncbi:VOC family protein [Spirillospora sp. NPDC048824]|uniref:VOC family protein n=1 Tax=Spirillospora sp. NPDC048824 TaxID=3364526 RepID=UPI00372211C1